MRGQKHFQNSLLRTKREREHQLNVNAINRRKGSSSSVKKKITLNVTKREKKTPEINFNGKKKECIKQ